MFDLFEKPKMKRKDMSSSTSSDQSAATREEMVEKLGNDIENMKKLVKHHEDRISALKTSERQFDESIHEMQDILANYYCSIIDSNEGAPIVSDEQSEKETIEQILTRKNSAAAVYYRLKTQRPEITQPTSLILKDVVGIVATLGKVHDQNLSRLLAEFLGLQTMLAVVCRTYDGAKALEGYHVNGSVCSNCGLCGLGASIGLTLDRRFMIIFLEKLRPYAGGFIDDDDVTQSQRKLDLHNPRLPSGELPPGFLGFAVNMIQVDESLGLRETLFYHLFSHLQVYKTRREMMNAAPLISHGAISLDGGIWKHNAVCLLGFPEDIGVAFPITTKGRYMPEEYVEMEERLKDKELKKEMQLEDLQNEKTMLNCVCYNLEFKKREFVNLVTIGTVSD